MKNPGGTGMSFLIASSTLPRPEMNVLLPVKARSQSSNRLKRVEVVPLVVVERRFLPEPPEHRIGVGEDLLVVGIVGEVGRGVVTECLLAGFANLHQTLASGPTLEQRIRREARLVDRGKACERAALGEWSCARKAPGASR